MKTDPEILKIKTMLKNGYFFKMWIQKKKDFAQDLDQIIKKWPSKYRGKSLGYAWQYAELEKKDVIDKLAYKQRMGFISDLKERSFEFEKDIRNFIEKHEIGEEWFLAITDYIISFWLLPPSFNLDIKENNKRVLLVLNPDTSQDDIRIAWDYIKNKQKELWPNFKRTNFSNKSLALLDIASKDRMERFSNDGTEFDSALIKKYKKKDLDITAKIWEDEEDISTETDRKRMAYLRKVRSRFNKKT